MVARLSERVVRRYAAQVVARGVYRPGPQMAQLKRVLQDIDRSKILTDFDLMADILTSVDLKEAKHLAHRLRAIHQYMKTFVLDALIDAGDMLELLESQARQQVAASEETAGKDI